MKSPDTDVHFGFIFDALVNQLIGLSSYYWHFLPVVVAHYVCSFLFNH